MLVIVKTYSGRWVRNRKDNPSKEQWLPPDEELAEEGSGHALLGYEIKSAVLLDGGTWKVVYQKRF
jgi:hypothetical protein